MKRGAVVALMLLTACATDLHVRTPPIRFQRIGVVLLRAEKPSAQRDLCKNAESTACAMGTLVISRDPCDFPGEYFAEDLCHEFAHALGHWPADHPH